MNKHFQYCICEEEEKTNEHTIHKLIQPKAIIIEDEGEIKYEDGIEMNLPEYIK